MKEASNITPIEMAEEGAYNILTMTSVAGVVGSLLTVCHIAMFHAYLSVPFLIVTGVFLVGTWFFPYLKRKRFGERNYSLGERVKRLELQMGSAA